MKSNIFSVKAIGVIVTATLLSVFCGANIAKADSDVIKLRVTNWEEYIDLGDWDDDEVIDLDNGESIIGVNPMIEDFEKWYYDTYGKKVKVEYSCFGTNEDMYNQLTLGDTYDLICPSDYMIMKLMTEGKLCKFSDEFYDKSIETNYYARNVSPYIKDTFTKNQINGESWHKYASCYMWGITGTVYDPEKITRKEASTFKLYNNEKYARQFTLKDNVRDTYFATLGLLNADKLMTDEFRNSPDYKENLSKVLNDVSIGTINESEKLLQDMMGKVYSLESDSGKADIVAGKIVANYQWSGDAVYSMNEAEEDDCYLEFVVPEECTNLWFDGWVMLKDGINGDPERQHVAESFVNFLARPDNVVRNMYYIGYTSAIAGNDDDDTIYQYMKWCYGDDEGDAGYPTGYFFSGDRDDERYILRTTTEQLDRQLFAQYPTEEVMERSAIMGYYNEEENKNINQMWINVRCFNVNKVPSLAWIGISFVALLIIIAVIYKRRGKFVYDRI